MKETSSKPPSAFALEHNYPNPFNPSTTIAYELPRRVAVKLEIFDMLGRRVRTLVDQRQQAGRYAIAWDGRNERGQAVASGTFFYSSCSFSFAVNGEDEFFAMRFEAEMMIGFCQQFAHFHPIRRRSR